MQQLILANILHSQSRDQCFRLRHTHEDPDLCNHNFTAQLHFNGFVLCQWRILSLWSFTLRLSSRWVSIISWETEFEGILPKGPYPPCLRMADMAPLARFPRIMVWYLYFTCQLTTHSAVCMDAHDDDVARPMGHTIHPSNRYTVLLWFVPFVPISSYNFMFYLPISFRNASLALGQSYGCSSISEVVLKGMDAIFSTPNNSTTCKQYALRLGCIQDFFRRL